MTDDTLSSVKRRNPSCSVYYSWPILNKRNLSKRLQLPVCQSMHQNTLISAAVVEQTARGTH